ncbi:hypothetical protein NDN08_004337 [Rhodosorus marinus]|uniref:Uncharacterized protein n=1 Tax=Rhodosorus marinus TaxID=101924 RepID=A0AAV8UPJ5_9RHOD|nr:hypothetical protein NDN08_004337 [Rhodosorus marinus]
MMGESAFVVPAGAPRTHREASYVAKNGRRPLRKERPERSLVQCQAKKGGNEYREEDGWFEDDPDTWKRLFEGMKERIVKKMKLEMDKVFKTEESNDSSSSNGAMQPEANANGSPPKDVAEVVEEALSEKHLEDLAREGIDIQALEEEQQGHDLADKSYDEWERALEDKLRQLADTPEVESDQDGEIDGVDGSEYYVLAEEDSDMDGENSSLGDAELGNVIKGIRASELRDELEQSLESIEGIGDVQALVGKVYDRIAKKNKISSSDGSPSLHSGDRSQGSREFPSMDKKNQIYDRVSSLNPEDTEMLESLVSADAKKAMNRALASIIGSLPESLFEMTIQTDRMGLGQLLYTSEVTGYFMRDGEIKLSRRSSQLVDEAEEEASPEDALPEAGARVKKNVSGRLSWWDPSRNERTYLNPQTYIHRLESEIEALKQQHDAAAANGAGETSARILEYASFAPDSSFSADLKDLTEDSADAMQRVVNTLLGRPSAEVQQSFTTGRDYISQVITWCLMVGYHVRDIESRVELDNLLSDK